MRTRDPRVDDYIGQAAEFARPILTHLRHLVHEGAPGAEETLKWGFPHFTQNGILCSMAAFKAHCTFGFWKGEEVVQPEHLSREAMGQFGRITSLEDLPPAEVIVEYVRRAVELDEEAARARKDRAGQGRKRRRGRPRPRERGTKVSVPEDFRAALEADPAARATFEAFPPSHQREYVEWITEAKREQTRRRRLATALEWLAEGKPRNWKYMKK